MQSGHIAEHARKRGSPRSALKWAAVCLVACPAASAAILLICNHGWTYLTMVSAALTLALLENVDGVRMPPFRIVETIGIALSTATAAVAPAVATALYRRSLVRIAESAAALYPAWLVVMIAPAIAIHELTPSPGAGMFKAQLSFEFMMAFSAGATSVALAYALWIRMHPETYRPRAHYRA